MSQIGGAYVRTGALASEYGLTTDIRSSRHENNSVSGQNYCYRWTGVPVTPGSASGYSRQSVQDYFGYAAVTTRCTVLSNTAPLIEVMPSGTHCATIRA